MAPAAATITSASTDTHRRSKSGDSSRTCSRSKHIFQSSASPFAADRVARTSSERSRCTPRARPESTSSCGIAAGAPSKRVGQTVSDFLIRSAPPASTTGAASSGGKQCTWTHARHTCSSRLRISGTDIPLPSANIKSIRACCGRRAPAKIAPCSASLRPPPGYP